MRYVPARSYQSAAQDVGDRTLVQISFAGCLVQDRIAITFGLLIRDIFGFAR
jgi:hypothetical protein